jgi:hypothetical protein
MNVIYAASPTFALDRDSNTTRPWHELKDEYFATG